MSTQYCTGEVAVWTANILTDRSGKLLTLWPGNNSGCVMEGIGLLCKNDGFLVLRAKIDIRRCAGFKFDDCRNATVL